MPDVSLNGIEFKIKGSADEASESVKKLVSELNELRDALKKSDGITGLATSLKKLENINTTMLSVAGTILKEISQIDFSNIRDAAQGIKDIAAAAREVANIGSKDKPLEQVIGEPDKLRTALSYVQQFGHALGSTLKFGLQGIGVAAKGMGSLIAQPFKRAIPHVKGFADKIKGVVGGFKRILGYRIIRSIIKEITQGFQEGVRNLYQWSKAFGGAIINGKNFAQTMDGLSSSLGYMKNSIGAMAAPLISMLAPAIDFVIDKVVALINVINQLFALLGGGGSWNKAIKKANEYEEAAGGAGGAAKKALEYLAPFDELNVLPDPKSGGGGGGGTDYAGMFEETTEFAEGLKDFADSIRAAIDAGDWQGLGQILGNKVNELVEKIDFAGIGSKIGGYINAWFTTKYWTLDTINFTNIGGKIAEFFNNAIGQIDFEIIGRSIVQRFSKIADLIIGAVEETDWGLVAKSIGDAVRGFFSEAGDWLQETDFAKLASSLYQGIKDAISNTDWAGIAQSIWRFIGSALGAAASFIAQLGKDIAADIKAAITTAWDSNGDGELTGKEIINGIWEGIKNAVKNVGQWIKDNIFTPFVEGFKSAFGIHSPAAEMLPFGRAIAEGILLGIKNVWGNIKTWLNENVWQPLRNAWNNLVGEDSAFYIPIKGEVEEITVGSTTHITAGEEFGGSHGSFTVEDGELAVSMNGAITKIQDKINASKKVISGIEAGLTKVKPDYNAPGMTQAHRTITAIGLMKTARQDYNASGMGQKYRTITAIGNIKTARQDYNATGMSARHRTITSIANMASAKDSLTVGMKQFSTEARFKKSYDGLTVGMKQFSTEARFKKAYDGLTEGMKQFHTQANFNAAKNGLTADDTTFSSNALFNKYTVSKDLADGVNMRINTTAVITKTKGNVSGNLTLTAQALGGVLQNGIWSSIPQYASGTTRAGSLFVAGEAGPEVVGHIGGRTEVLNRSQLAATMYSAVKSAMASVAFHVAASPSANYTISDADSGDALYRAFRRALDETDFGGDIELDGQTLYKAMVNRNRQNTRVTGVNAMA